LLAAPGSLRADLPRRTTVDRYLYGFFFGALAVFNAFIWGAVVATFF
jgi:hypothetical protein